jgi:hypothetical protein
MRPNLRAFDDLAAHVEQRAKIGVDHGGPLFQRHAVKLAVARDAGIVYEHVDRSEIGLDLLHAGGAGIERRDVPFVDVDARFGLEFLRGVVVAAVSGGDLITGRLERLTDRGANAARTPSDQCNAGHNVLPLSPVGRPGHIPGISVLFCSQHKDVDGRDKFYTWASQ